MQRLLLANVEAAVAVDVDIAVAVLVIFPSAVAAAISATVFAADSKGPVQMRRWMPDP